MLNIIKHIEHDYNSFSEIMRSLCERNINFCTAFR